MDSPRRPAGQTMAGTGGAPQGRAPRHGAARRPRAVVGLPAHRGTPPADVGRARRRRRRRGLAGLPAGGAAPPRGGGGAADYAIECTPLAILGPCRSGGPRDDDHGGRAGRRLPIDGAVPAGAGDDWPVAACSRVLAAPEARDRERPTRRRGVGGRRDYAATAPEGAGVDTARVGLTAGRTNGGRAMRPGQWGQRQLAVETLDAGASVEHSSGG